ncbi:MAG: NADH-quinone oxidoreductase subunit C [Chloroflexi bacterium]|nr:NADH-quinone oxidoreductase subunit C [Chloroflexota bacterium]
MTAALSGREVARQITERFPEALIEASDTATVINSESLLAVVAFLKETAGLDFDYLSSITAVDYYDYFELVYLLTSMRHNHSLVVKTRCYGRENPTVSSLVSLYQGADFQEREIYDLMGIRFEGHSNLKRIVLWEGFEGHPLRKDYL